MFMQYACGLLKEAGEKLISSIPIVGKVHDFIESLRKKYTSITDQLFLNNLETVLMYIEKPFEQDSQCIVDSFNDWLCKEGKVEQFLLWISNIKNKAEIVYFANLVRCACVNKMDSDLFMIQLNLLQSISLPSIQYLERYSLTQKSVERNYYVTSLYWYGLFAPVDIGEYEIVYAITELGIVFKRYCLNYNGREVIPCKKTIELSPINVPEPMTQLQIKETLYGRQ